MNRVKRWCACLGLLFACATAVLGQTSVNVFADDFEGVFPGASWQVGDSNTADGLAYWGVVNNGFGGCTPHGGNAMVYCAGVGYTGTAANPFYRNKMNAYMKRKVDLSNYSSASLSFASYIASVMSAWDFCRVYVYSTSGSRTKLWEQSPATGDTAWSTQTLSLNNFVGTGQTSVVIQFEFDSNDPWTYEGWFLDDIALTAQPLPVDLFLTNLVVSPTYMKQGASPTNLQFGVGLTPQSGAINGRNVTVNFYLSTNATLNAASPLIGSVPLTLTNQPGRIVTNYLAASQLAGIVIPASFRGTYTVIARLQPMLDDPNTNNDWTATTVRVDDYPDALSNATSITTNTQVTGTIEMTNDVDCVKVAFTAGHQYAVTTMLLTLTGAVTTLYGPDQQTLLLRTNSWTAGTSNSIPYYCATSGTYYLQLAGWNGATGTYSVLVKPQSIDLGLTNLVISPNYLKQGGNPTAVSFSVNVPATIDVCPATVNFYLTTNRVINTNYSVGSVTFVLTNPPGRTATVNLSSNQVSGLAIHAATGGTYTVIARLQPMLDDPNTNNDWTATTVLVDDYPDALSNATSITTNTEVTGTIEVTNDVDCVKVAFAAGHQYAVTTMLLTLTGAVTTLYGPDQQTLLLRTNSLTAGTSNSIPYYCATSGTYYLQLTGWNGATGTYSVLVQPQRIDLGLTNLVISPNYLKQGANPTAIRFGVSLSAVSAPISGYAATVNFYLTSNRVINTNNPVGSIPVVLTNQPGNTVTVNLSSDQINGLAMHVTTGGTYTAIARLQSLPDDPNTNNDWTATTVLVDDYPDTLVNATLIATNTATTGLIERIGDVDCMKVALMAGHQYAVRTTLGALTGAVTRFYGVDRQTILTSNTISGIAGTSTNVPYYCATSGTYYLQLAGWNGATGTYTILVQPQSIDLGLTNLVVSPNNLKQGASPVAVRFGVSLSAPIDICPVTVNFYLTTNPVINTNPPVGSVSITLSNQPGGMVTVNLSPDQVNGLAIHEFVGGMYTVIARLQPALDDPNTNNNWTTTSVRVDDYPDNLVDATSIPTNTVAAGMIEVAGDVDCMKVALTAGHQYAVTTSLGTLTGAVTTLYGPDRQTVLGTSMATAGAGSHATISCLIPDTGGGTYYIRVNGSGSATGTYAVVVQFQETDLSLANLQFLPYYLKKGASPTNVTFDVGLSASSAAINGRPANVSFYLSGNATYDASDTPLGSATIALTIQPGHTATVALSPSQLAGIAVPPTAGGPCTVFARLQDVSDDTNTNNDWAATAVLVDDYVDTFADAYRMLLNTNVAGMLEDRYDVDDFQLTLQTNNVYVITLEPGPGDNALTNAVLRLYQPGTDYYTLVATSTNDTEWLGARITHAPSASDTYYIQVAGANTNANTGTYTLHIREQTPVNTNITVDVEAISVSLSLASGSVLGKHPVAINYELRNNSLSNRIDNSYYLVDFYLSPTNDTSNTNSLQKIGHSEINVSIDLQQTIDLSVPVAQLNWTTISADLSNGVYFVWMHVRPVRDPIPLAPVDPNDTNNWITGNSITSPRSTPVIFGKVTYFDTGVGVTNVCVIFVPGIDGHTNTFTNPSGNYSISVTNGWIGSVTPSCAGNVFSPTNRTYANVTNSWLSQNFVMMPHPVISGTVRDLESGDAVAGVIVHFTGSGTYAATTDVNGAYSTTVAYGWSGTGTVTFIADGTFFPTDHRSYTNVTENQNGQDFTWVPPPMIAGAVRDFYTGNGVAGVRVSFTGISCTSTSDSSGYYTLSVPYGKTGMVTLINTITPNGGFLPANRDYGAGVTEDQLSQDFTWYRPPVISGTVWDFDTGDAVAGVKVSCTGSVAYTATTDINGAYSMTVVYGWSGTVTSMAGGTFWPTDHRSFANVTEDQKLIDFIWIPSPVIEAPDLMVSCLNAGATNKFVLQWNSEPNQFYALQASTNLLKGFDINLGIHLPATPPTNVYTDNVDNVVQKFYRVLVR